MIKEPKLTLCTSVFHAVAVDQDHVSLRIRPIAFGPYYDAKRIFGDKESRLVCGVSDHTIDGKDYMVIHVRKDNLMELSSRIHDIYSVCVPTYGIKDDGRIGYRNGSFTPCATPHDAMVMALDHS